MKLSFCYLSHRPGSIDLLADSLSKQVKAGTDPDSLSIPDWELIVIDGFPGRVQRGAANQYVSNLGIPVRHYGLPKVHTFPWARTGFANAHNTGMIYATGTHVVFLNDFCWFPGSTAYLWGRAFDLFPNHLICGVGVTYNAKRPDVESKEGGEALSDVYTWRELDMRRDWTPREPWVPEVFDTGYWGGPIEYFERVNGMDERSDFCASWGTASVVAQARMHGMGLRVDRTLVTHMVDHREWENGQEGLYRIKSEIADVPEEPIWTGWSCNPYLLREERRRQMELMK